MTDQKPAEPVEPTNQLKGLQYITSADILKVFNINPNELLELAIANTHPLYRFEKQDDHRMGIRSFKVFSRSTDEYLYFLTISEDDLEEI